jgi:clan AA aspartic protease (TIGR02281 family)
MIPYNFELQGRKIIVRPEILHKGKSFSLPMILDTGAGRTVISKNVALYLGINPKSASKSERLVSANSAFEAKIVTIDRFQCFDILIKNLEVAIVDIPPQAQVSGMLGVDFLLKIKKFSIDFINKQIVI